jgi:FlaA1/EpsC-like NDP-sugar epimerase
LFEEINCQGEAYRPTQHPRIMRFVTAPEEWSRINAALEQLGDELHRADPHRLKQLIQQSLPEYTPDVGVKVPPAPDLIPNGEPSSPTEPDLATNRAG